MMNDRISALCQRIISPSYVDQGRDARKSLENKIAHLLEQKKWPEYGWSEQWIEMLLAELALMDSNNFSNKCQVGEREGRILSNLVARRHYRFCHGVGRSGFLTEVQPKAAGSSLLMKITNSLVTDAIKQIGLTSASSAFIVPLATGMSLTFCMLMFKKNRGGKFVLWSRIDQKSCIKSVLAAGLELVVLENLLEGDEICTDVNLVVKTIERLGPENVVCFMSTTSCFAPRAPDRLEEIGMICKKYGVPHLVNNAYGLQSSKCIHLIQQAQREGRVDVVVQSTDKNFLVPVGGSILVTFDSLTSNSLCSLYPGRASASPHLDMLITLLEVGSIGYRKMLQTRKENFEYLKSKMEQCALKFDERLLHSPNNRISIGMTLQNFPEDSVTFIGSMLFKRMVSGVRVIARNNDLKIEEHRFKGFGSSHENYPFSYLTAAAAIGITKEDIDLFIQKLTEVLSKAHGRDSMFVQD